MNKRKRIIKTALSLVLAFAMAFAPIFSSYAVLVTAFTADPADLTVDNSVEEAETIADDEDQSDADPSLPDDESSEAQSDETDTGEIASDDLNEPDADQNNSASAESDSEAAPDSSDAADAAAEDEQAAAEEPEPDEEAEQEPEATRAEYVYQGNGVKVTAVLDDPEAIPDDAELVAKPVTKKSGEYDYDAYMDALNRGSDSSYDENNTLLYDVAFIKDGVELQPTTGKVSVSFEFLDSQLSEALGAEKASDVNVIHLPLSDTVKDKYDTTADAKNISADDIVVDEVTKSGNGLVVSVKNEKVKFETSDFSVFAYTVDFAYTDPETGTVYTYNLEGEGSITLKELAVILGMTSKENANDFIKKVDDVKFSNEDLVKVEKTLLKGWVLKSLAPFSSEELLTITMKDGTVIQVKVTDVQESDELKDFLTNVIITGATQISPGTYEVEQGKNYSIILAFAENSSHQFANDHTLTYQMPAGITIIEQQTGGMAINIVYRGRTYQVDASYDLDTTGELKIKFNEDDPDYHRLVESTNVSFRFTYTAEFDGSKTEIKFSDEIERDLVFDGPTPGQTYAEKSAVYDETTGKFTYTIKVTATGDVTDVNVRDVISGNALIFNNDVQVSGNSSDYTDNGASNGFDYTFASMREGEEITITYTANVDFSKDTDGDGKISVDQTKNTVTVKPGDGDPHTSEYSREITFKSTKKSNGTEAGTTEDGDKIIEWTIDYNELALVKAGGDTITDRISTASAEYMKYYGTGITVEVRDHSGNLIRSQTIPYGELTEHSDSSWKYTIPETDTQPYSYHITYQTVVDMSKINNGTGTAVTLDNTANDDSGSVIVGPDEEISVVKNVESFDTQKVTWVATLTVPEEGLSQAVVTDSFPHIYLEEGNFWDTYDTTSLEIEGLLPGESYTPVPSATNLVITFFKDSGKTQTGLQEHPGGHTITVRLTTNVNQTWLQKGYESSEEYEKKHTNTIDFNGKTDTATVVFDKPGIEKTGELAPDDDRGILYTIKLKGVSDVPVSVSDSFDTSLLEVDTTRSNQGLYGDHMRIRGGIYGPASERVPVSYSDTSDGIILTANSLPMQADGHYYPYYWITYYLKLKDGVDLQQLAIENGGEYDLINTALWADHETSYTYKTIYDYLDKELLNAGELGGTDRTAQYRITFNKAKAVLNGGNPMEMKDVLSSNLSIDYSSIQITTDPPGAEVPYSLSGGKDDHGVPDGTTVATYTVPDATKVVITYDAFVRGTGTQTIINKVSVNDRDETIENVHDYGSASEGEGAIASFKIVKVDGYDANKKLEGVQFKIFAENPDIDFGPNVDHAKEITLTTNEDGEIILDGAAYDFYFDEVYHVQEIDPPPDYGNIGFDYLVTLTNNMSLVDYGHYIYYYNDTMQIKNWPLEGLVVEKQVDSDDDADKDRYYTFRISILNEDGTVNTDYNEKNGDDQFENGVVEFKIKDKEQKMFWGFLKGTKYKVEEIDADGFTTTVTYSIFNEEGEIIDTKTEPSTSHTGELTQEDEVVIFKNSKLNEHGSLKIKKNVTVNGAATTGTSADGTYTFTITGPGGYTSEQTITITNGASNEARVDNLVPGTYTVSEDTSKNPDGMALVGDNDIEVEVAAGEEAEIKTAEFTNNKTEVGSLKIKKNVTVNGAATTGTSADGTYTFTITGPGGYTSEQTITITNGASNEVQIDDLVPGTYTVSEDTSKNPDGMALVGDNDIEVEVAAGEEAEIKTAEFTNNKTEVGSLKIKKNVTVNGAATTGTSADGTYTFTITGPGGYTSEQTITITNGASNEVQIDDLVPGTYTVSEDTSKNPDGMALVGDNDIEVEVAAGEEAEIKTAEFTNNKTEVGSLKIKKNVTVNGAATTGTSADGTYTFEVKDKDGAVKETVEITITNGASNEVQVDNLVPGTYTVSEDTSKNPDGMALVGDNDIEVEVAAGEEAEIKTAEFTNNKTEVGSLKIKKNVTVNGAATTGTSADGTYTFEVKDKDGAVKETVEITITNGASNEVQVDNLVPGTYTVSEDTSKNPDGMALVGDNDIEVEVAAGEEAEIKTAEFTNNKTEVGSLKIKKNVTVNGAATTGTSADGTYTFEVKDKDGAVKETVEITITNGASNEVQVDNLVPGTYTVSEDTSKNPDGMSLVGDNDIEVEVAAGEEAEIKTAEFTNNKTEVGSLKIKKNVTVNGAATTGTSADGTYTFTITGPGGYTSEQTITITNGASNEVQIDDLVPGTYTVSEDTSKNPDGMALVGDNDIEVEVAAGEEAEIKTAEFTNNKTEVGSLKIKKNVTVNGAATTGTSADGTYTFEVKDKDGAVKETVEITITNGASNEVQVDNLVPGTYTVSEDTSKNPDGMALVGDNDIEVEVTAGEEAEIKTAEFTNNKTEVGSLKIKKNVTVNGAATTGTSADGTYTFTITGPGGYTSEQTITITNGASNEARVDNLVPGTYTVSEDTSKNPDGMALVGDNDIEVEVAAGEEAEIKTAEFTNNKTEVGSLKIKKNVTVNGAATTGTSADGTYTFTITGPGSYTSEQTITITNGASNEVQVDNLVPGTYTVSEDTSKNPDGMALVGDNDIEVEVAAGEEAEIKTAEFTNNKTEVGSLKIKKNVTVNGAATTGTSADGTYTFEVKDKDGAVKETVEITITNGASNEVQVDNLVPGTYTVSEDTSKNPDGMALVGDNDIEVEVAAGEEAEIKTAEFTNNKTEVGSLKIKKNVTVNGAATTGTSADGTYTFEVKDKDGAVKETVEITITNGASNEVQVDNLVPGTYTVSEDTSKNPDGMSLVGDNDIEVEVAAGEEAEIKTAEFTNNKTEVGSLKIKKNVTVNGAATTGTSADGTYTFTITGPGSYTSEQTITITNGASNEVQIDDLVPGTYTVSEDTSKNPDGMALVGDNDIEVEVAAGEEAEIKTAEFTNNKTEVGSLKIKKNVTVNGAATTGTSADGTYTFEVKDKDGAVKETVEITITNGASNEVQVDNLVPGTYTVSEDTSKNPDGMSLVGDNDIEVEIAAGEEAEIKTAEFTNNKTEVGSLKIKKNVTVNGAATTGTSADGTYTFTISGPDGYTSEQTITITNGASNEVQVDDLLPGEYKVKEKAPTNGTSLVGDEEVTVTVAANNTSNIPTAEFTNDYSTIGYGEIKVQKLLKGRDWTNSDSFTFSISAADGTPMPAQKSITIRKSDKNQTKSFGKIKFTEAGTYTYKIKEAKGRLKGVTYDETEHTVTIKVRDNGKGELIADGGKLIQTEEFTNTYEASGTAGEIMVQKVLNGRKWNDNDEFEFTISAPAGTPMPEERSISVTKEDADHIVSFGEIEFTEAGKYTYTIKERKGNEKGMTYDTKAHKVTIEVVDDGNGKLKARNGTKLIQIVKITNTYRNNHVTTGDDSNMLGYMAIMAGAILAFVMVLVYRRKHRA